ncbi:MAG: methyl-galactoside ABC transporter substrate-binding protein [Treponema sp. GWB1_62_6]|nr:MAG: methyl-galactoside ABC transporter substrate-binding protein [Treponema sp. GWA1_62_8]OHE66836.1 MAG: methyl-galactoside ABC transporter substrate-binding protein [Treponema sp. GWB1_62_6]OHE67942.1 MAG: methyl-galactoside ABC transporter substrate-binding protein [Treponema sp. GWC1_61_84]OHE70799.1 MAG: methyl-galactoside ABC transporter substrate-binding protein [Treponema sp. RIFOXYC1_FULL_61_9]HCM25103.1 galactose/glucose ABC transporter substrate-binding protein MglB [Treponema sp
MKRSAALLFSLLFLVSFGMTVSAQANPKIGVCIYKFDDTFMSYVRNQIETAAKGKATLSVQDSQYDQPKQNDQIDQFIVQGMQTLAINMVDPSAVSVLIGKAQKKNLPLVLFNREPVAADMAKYAKAYYVGAKAQESGTMEGDIVADYWKANPSADLNKDGVLQYVMLIGDPSNTDAKFRTEYSIKAVTAAGIKVQKLAEDTAMWDRPKAQEKMAAWLTAYAGKIEVVFANNDDMALGAIEALKAAGFFKGGKYMPVVGVDATPPALDALEQGYLLGTVLNDAKRQGLATWDLAYSLAQGKKAATAVAPLANADGKADPNGKYVWVPYVKVTKANYTQFK